MGFSDNNILNLSKKGAAVNMNNNYQSNNTQSNKQSILSGHKSANIWAVLVCLFACLPQSMAASLETVSPQVTDSGMYWSEEDQAAVQNNRTVPTLPFGGGGSLTTPLLGGNNHRGVFFDVVATNEITVCRIDISAFGDTDFEIYYRNGTHVSFENNSAAWNLIGSANNVISPGLNIPSELPIPVNTTITVGSNHAFYVTSSDTAVSVAYTDGTAVGNTLVSDANLSILEGGGGEYPFLNGGTLFSPRNFNGTVHYDVGSGAGTCLTYTVGGNVTDLNGSVTLQNNGGDDITLNADGGFTFPGQFDGADYDITVSSQPAIQSCAVSNGTGTIAGADITDVAVTCTTNTYAVGGNVTGLDGSVTLQNNAGDDITLNADGGFTFSAQDDQTTYNVSISSQPATQTCSVTDGSGTLAGADVTNVSVSCTTNTYTVGGSVVGLTGSITLQNNGGDDITLNADGGFTFTAQNDGSAYAVTVSSQPALLNCSVSNGSGTLAGGNVTDVLVNCSANTYTVGGNVSGLNGSLTLQNNGGDDITLNADGGFTFTAQNDATAYNVTISSQPATQLCTVTGGSGTLAGTDVTNVSVACSTTTYTVGGNVSGLIGSVTVQNNGGDDITMNANGAFNFATALADTSVYAVTVLAQPASQTCTVNNGSGSVSGANISNVMVVCESNSPNIDLSTTSLNYTPVVIGQSQNSIITVTNTGSGDLVISGFNQPALPFNMVGGSCLNTPVTLLPGESCQIEVSFNPNTVGSFNDAISILSNATSSPDLVQLVGNGIAGAPATPVPGLNILGLLLLISVISISVLSSRKSN